VAAATDLAVAVKDSPMAKVVTASTKAASMRQLIFVASRWAKLRQQIKVFSLGCLKPIFDPAATMR